MKSVAALTFAALTAMAASNTFPVYKGFNSWDSFKGDVNESAFLDIASQVQKLLLPAGELMMAPKEWLRPKCRLQQCW